MILNEYDTKILNAIARYGYLTISQAAFLTGRNAQHEARRLRQMEAHRLLSSFGNRRFNGFQHMPKLLYLQPKGWECLEELDGQKRAKPKTPQFSQVLRHRLACVDVALALEKGLESLPAIFLEKLTCDFTMVNTKTGDLRKATTLTIGMETLIPDVIAVLFHEEKRAFQLLLIEVDCVTEVLQSRDPKRSLVRRFERYASFLLSQLWKQFRGLPMAGTRVLFLTTGAHRRIQNLRSALRGLDRRLNKHVLFSTVDAGKQDFFGNHWLPLNPNHNDPLPLIGKGTGTSDDREETA